MASTAPTELTSFEMPFNMDGKNDEKLMYIRAHATPEFLHGHKATSGKVSQDRLKRLWKELFEHTTNFTEEAQRAELVRQQTVAAEAQRDIDECTHMVRRAAEARQATWGLGEGNVERFQARFGPDQVPGGSSSAYSPKHYKDWVRQRASEAFVAQHADILDNSHDYREVDALLRKCYRREEFNEKFLQENLESFISARASDEEYERKKAEAVVIDEMHVPLVRAAAAGDVAQLERVWADLQARATESHPVSLNGSRMDKDSYSVIPASSVPLYAAVAENKLEVVKWLLGKGAKADAKMALDNNKLTSPLYIAAQRNNEVLFSLLLSHGADANWGDYTYGSYTTMPSCSSAGERGGEVNDSVLGAAARAGSINMVKQILAVAKGPEMSGDDFNTDGHKLWLEQALSAARQAGHNEIASLLAAQA